MDLEAEKQKAKDLIAKSEHIALLLPQRPGIDCLAAAEAASRVLSGQGKQVGFLPHVALDAPPAPKEFSHILNPRSLTREFIIAVDTIHSPVAELRYEKHPDKIEIILSPKSSPVREEAFSFREGKAQCDCLVAIGVPDAEAVPVAELGIEPQFFTETPIINIGNSAGHKPYGEANLLPPEETPLSEIAYELVKTIQGGPLDPETATILLTGIMNATDNFRSPVRVGTHLAAADLLQIGADQARAAALAQGEQPIALLQLAARASVRSKESDGGRALWSFLTGEDFEKTGRSSGDVPYVLELLRRFFTPHPIHVLLWQEPGTPAVQAIIRAPQETLAALAERLPGELRNSPAALKPDAAFASFQDAEERIAALLVSTR